MKKQTLLLSTVIAAVLLASCSELPKEAYYSHGQPESLLQTSQDEAAFSLASPKAEGRVAEWIAKVRPTHAALSCQETSKTCNKVERLLRSKGVETSRVASRKNNLIMTYSVVKARDCENRYIDNMINPYNLNHPTYGCTVASNMVQMVTNRRDFIEPQLGGKMDAPKAVQVIDGYYTTPKADPVFSPITTSQTMMVSNGSR